MSPAPGAAVLASAAAGARPGAPTGFSRAEWLELARLYFVIALLHGAGWALWVRYSGGHPALVGLGLAAYMLGLRHAFDVDHIAAVDDTVRYLLQQRRNPLAVGFFFSLGHSSVVFALAVGLAVATAQVADRMPGLREAGLLVGAAVSGVFLVFVGLLNLRVFLGIVKVWGRARSSPHDHEHIESLLAGRGLLNRLFGRRLTGAIRHSWQMYPVGVLFGLGFDTASEVGLLAMTAGAAAADLPAPAILCLPLLFAAGMSAIDTTDGVLMCKAYRWAFVNPVRKVFYNLATTGLSVVVALGVGAVELAQLSVRAFDLDGPAARLVQRIDFGTLGYAVVVAFLVVWAVAAVLWRLGRFERRFAEPARLQAHEHVHEHIHPGGLVHSHRHFHGGGEPPARDDRQARPG